MSRFPGAAPRHGDGQGAARRRAVVAAPGSARGADVAGAVPPVHARRLAQVVRCPIFVTFEGQEVMLMAIESPIIGKNVFFHSGYLGGSCKLRVQEPKLGNMFRNKPWRFTKKKLGYPSGHQIYRVGPLKGDVSGQSWGWFM